MPRFSEVTLDTVCEGSAKELFDRAMKEVLDNIQDVNTDPEATRKISLIFSFAPSEDRASSNVTLRCEVKRSPHCLDRRDGHHHQRAGSTEGLYERDETGAALPARGRSEPGD